MRVNLGPNITDARGKLGEQVHSIWKAGVHYVRALAVDAADPETDLQILMRSCKSAAYDAWSALSAAIKALWEEYAKQFIHRNQDLNQGGGTTNLIPHHRPPVTGQMAFVQAYLRLCRHNFETYSVPATAGQPCLIEDLAVAWDNVDNELDITWTAPAGCSFVHTVMFNEPFEDEAVNDTPNLWDPVWTYIVGGNGSIKVVNTQSHGGTKSCEILRTAAGAVYHASIPLSGLDKDSTTISYWAMATTNTTNTALLRGARFAPLGIGPSVKLGLTGNIEYRDGPGWVVAQAYAPNVWYHIKYVLHDARRQYDLYIDDVLIKLNADYRDALNIDALNISLSTVGHNKPAYIDDIVVEHSNQWLRTWLLSYQGKAHKQIVMCTPVSNGVAHITEARYAGGGVDDLDNNHGLYYIQCDVLGITEEQNGLLSVPSQIFREEID